MRIHFQVAPLEKEERARTKPSLPSFDCGFLTRENADTTLEYENEPSPEVFQEVTIYSCVEVVVRITVDIPLLTWILHYATKMRTGRGWKKSVAQFGDEELTSFVKRIIQGVFVCHCDRTKTIVHTTRSGILRGTSWTRQILNDAWESTDWENLFDNPLHTVIAETKLVIEDQPRMSVKEPLEVECRKFYVLYANIEAHGHMGSCPGYALLILQCENELSMRVFQESMRVFQESMSRFMVRETKRLEAVSASEEWVMHGKIVDEIEQRNSRNDDRILRISTGYDTSMRITDEVSLFNWISHFAVKLLNKLSIDRR